MDKNVIVSLKGFQYVRSDDENKPVEIMMPGVYYHKNGQHYVVFDEVEEGLSGKTHSVLKFTEDRLLVRRSGTIEVEMLFEKEKRTCASYHTPFGMMNLQIAATSFRLEEEENRIDYRVGYALTVEDDVTADCEVEIRIESKHGGEFHLTDSQSER